MNSFYRKPLPEGLLPFSSDEGRRIFAEALAAGTLEGWFPLAESFRTQADPAFCGLGSLVVALNALAIDPGRTWKGVWRWYSEELLDCCKPLDRVQSEGVTLDELACLARCNGASATITRPDDTDLSHFRATIERVSAARGGEVLLVAYSRSALGQTGEGHFSPVAGYHAGRDLALVLDVATFKYPPHWVPVSQLFEAQRPLDADTGRSRGTLLLRPAALPMRTALRLSLDTSNVDAALTVLRHALDDLPEAEPDAALRALVQRIPRSMWPTLRPVEGPDAERRTHLLAEIADTPLYASIAALPLDLPPEHGAALPWALVQVAMPRTPAASTALRTLAEEGLSPPLREELTALRTQVQELARHACCA